MRDFGRSLRNVPPWLREFELRDHLWPSPLLVRPAAELFPHLRVLQLHQELTWCGLCNLCTFPLFKEHPPSEMVYSDGDGLPKLNNRVLAPLRHQHTVYLTVGYSLTAERGTSLQELKFAWRGECAPCMNLMFCDEAFREDWENKNKEEA